VRSRWLDFGQVLFWDFIDRDPEAEVYENAKKNKANTAIFTDQAWSVNDLLYGQKEKIFLLDLSGKSRAGEIDPSC